MKWFWLIVLLMLGACSEKKGRPNLAQVKEKTPSGTMGFTNLESSKTGVSFANELNETEDLNYFSFEYMYNGGGVAIGDINNDGLPDIYLSGNQVEDKLYLNKGNLSFEDISASALGAQDNHQWHNGVVMVDINEDGLLDIYVSCGGNTSFSGHRENLLYINKGGLKFEESASEYGLNDSLSSTQTTFADFDKDGDLDAYVMNVPVDFNKTAVYQKDTRALFQSNSNESDHLYLNESGKFVDRSKAFGVNNHAHGLGLVASDLNGDGIQDVYVSNDYYIRDYAFFNSGEKLFELSRNIIKHQSNFAMGVDVADINNDGFQDILVLDMAYSDHVRSKQNMASMSTARFERMQEIGEHKQYMINTLQLNVGNGNFSEIAQFSGLSKTDWSWCPLIIDLDNDGLKDVVITNGYRKEAGNRDFQQKVTKLEEDNKAKLEMVDLMPESQVSNKVFRNKGSGKFEDVTEKWNFNKPMNSNGMAWGDLDNDGDLDLVINNMDAVASIYENKSTTNYVQISLEGPGKNRFGIGASCKITQNKNSQYAEFNVARGYLSSSQAIAHFGLPNAQEVTVEITWPDGKKSITQSESNRHLKISYDGASHFDKAPPKKKWFALTDVFNEPFVHQEDDHKDYMNEVLLPHSQSRFGPDLAVGDLNGDGEEDLYVCGAYGQKGGLYFQNSGQLVRQREILNTSKTEEQGVHFFDADGDRDLDIYIAKGGPINSKDLIEYNQDQLFLNDGNGRFGFANGALPIMNTSTKCIMSGDVDGDGDLDLFVGGRTVHGRYPFSPESYLLKNNNGKFEIDTVYQNLGMITDALFTDYDEDKDVDLILVGELMPITFLENENGVFQYKDQGMDKTNGFWQSIASADLDNDGDLDYIVGNIGENNKFHPTINNPLEIFTHDFDENGTLDIILSKYQKEKHYPVRGKECSAQQMPFIAQQFPTYSAFSTAEVEDIYPKEKLEESLKHYVYTMSSAVIWNNKGVFNLKTLPPMAQIGPIADVEVMDLNKDGISDMVLSGNFFDTEPETPAYDCSHGTVILGSKNQDLETKPFDITGWFAPWNIRSSQTILMGNEVYILLGVNNGSIQSYKVQ